MSEKIEKTIKGKSLSEKIAEYKSKYGKVYSYEVEGTDGTSQTLLFKQPGRQVLSAATVTAKNDPLKYNEIVLKNCLIDGDVDLLNDDSIFYGISAQLEEMIDSKVGTLKKH